MVRVSVAQAMDAPPERTWATLSDLPRFADWLVPHEDWRDDPPAELVAGVTLTSVISVLGLRKRIAWRVVSYEEPRSMTICGDGVGGIAVALRFAVRPDRGGSVAELAAEVTGKPLFGPIGPVIGKFLHSDLQKSARNLQSMLC